MVREIFSVEYMAEQMIDLLDGLVSNPSPIGGIMAAHEFTITRRVEFSETDMAGIVHFSNFCRYMEHAEHAFFRSLDH